MDQRSELFNQNLYQIPSCTICLCEMTEDLASLGCGHVFHISCITQHFQYKGTCPNCQKRAQVKQIRLVVFPVHKNTKTSAYLQTLLSSIEKSEGQQVQGLLLQIKVLSEKLQKHQYNNKQLQKQLRKKTQQAEKIKREIESKTVQLAKIQKEYRIVKQQSDQTNLQLLRVKADMIQLRVKYDGILTQRKQMQNYKAIRFAAEECSKQLIKFKTQLQNKQTPPDVMAKNFFQMLQLKNLNALRTKQKRDEMTEKIRFKQEQNIKLRNQIQGYKKQSSSQDQQILKWKAKYEKLKDKYKQLFQKSKSKTQQNVQAPNQIQENSLSLSFGFASRVQVKVNTAISSQKPEKNQRQVTFNFVEKPKEVQQPKLTFGANALKRPAVQYKKPISLKNFMNV